MLFLASFRKQHLAWNHREQLIDDGEISTLTSSNLTKPAIHDTTSARVSQAVVVAPLSQKHPTGGISRMRENPKIVLIVAGIYSRTKIPALLGYLVDHYASRADFSMFLQIHGSARQVTSGSKFAILRVSFCFFGFWARSIFILQMHSPFRLERGHGSLGNRGAGRSVGPYAGKLQMRAEKVWPMPPPKMHPHADTRGEWLRVHGQLTEKKLRRESSVK